MKKIISFLILSLFLSSSLFAKGNQPEMKFKDGKFRIVQFTDIHWKPYAENCATTEATIRKVIAAEKPQLAVITGDVICYDPATDGWRQVMKIFEDTKTPFTVTLGNHDAEYLTKDSIYNILLQSPMYVGDKGPENLHGCGNTAIVVEGSDGTPAGAIYMIDSNDYQPFQKLGHYDWIHFDQIAWFRDKVEELARGNNGKPLPALAFFHIPLMEYGEVINDDKTYGNMHEGAGAPGGLNSGLFASVAEMSAVMGIFTGHDHDNDYVGMTKDVALGFGRTTGAEAYGVLKRGGRVFDMYEGKNKFDTWVTTPDGKEPAWHYPSGLNDEDAARMAYLPAVKQKGRKNGVNYIYYEGLCKHTTHIADSMKRSSGVMKNFDITKAPAEDHFAYRFHTRINIPEHGVYRFYTYSDDGSVLRIDGKRVVDNDGGHSARRREGKVALEPGFHDLSIDYFENYMGQQLEVGFSGVDIDEQLIPDSMLFIPDEEANPLYNAFSHNDYAHARPLSEALEFGFNCVEADCYLVGDRMVVAHDLPDDTLAYRYLEDLYLEPLFDRINRNGGSVYKGADRPFYLMIDIKRNGDNFYEALRPVLEANADKFCSVDPDGKFTEGPILLFFSGSRPLETLPSQKTPRYASLDGKFEDLGKGIPNTLMPVVSDNYQDFMSWNGKGKISAKDLKTLRSLVKQAHSEGKLIRFWGAPDTEEWAKLQLREGVDIVGVDNLEALSRLLSKRKK